MKWISLILLSILIWGCNDNNQQVNVDDNSLQTTIPEGLFTKDKPLAPKSVLEARKLQAGDKVTVVGKVIGRQKPFVDNRAIFVIGDPQKLTSCDLRPDDDCATPWDVCCEAQEDVAAATLSVQVVDSSGAVLKTGLKGKDGLKGLSNVIIQGVVAEHSTDKAMTVTAEKIYHEKVVDVVP